MRDEVMCAQVLRSESVGAATDAFLGTLSHWVASCISEFSHTPPSDGHDQLTYTTSWATLVRDRHETRVLDFLRKARDRVRDHFVASGAWRHGYWRRQEVHHGTEHFELFLGTLWTLAPEDTQTIEQLTDAAEHFGNWNSDGGVIPDFFDWETGLFRSTFLGTEEVALEPHHWLNVPDHFRLLNVALLAHEATGDSRYRRLAEAHASRWADAIVASDTLPVALRLDGTVHVLDAATRQEMRELGHASALMQPGAATELDRAENFVASNAVQTLLRLGHVDAARRILDAIVQEVGDPDAAAAVAVFRDYRRITGSTRYDRQIIEAAQAQRPENVRIVGIRPRVPRSRRPMGIGKRVDMPAWFEDGEPMRCSPALLAFAAELTGSERLAAEAVDLARTRFELALRVYPSGRHHGCSARSVSAVARGHGRDNNAGMVTAVLDPVLEWRRMTAAGSAA